MLRWAPGRRRDWGSGMEADRWRTLRALAREGSRRVRSLVDKPLDYVPRVPERIVLAPPDILPGDVETAHALYEGRWVLAEHEVQTGGHSPLKIVGQMPAWHRALHGFGWLRHSRAADTELARAHARAITEDWIVLHGRGEGEHAWEPEVVAARFRHWLSHSRVLVGHEDDVFLEGFLPQLALHHRFVRRAMRDARDPLLRLRLLGVLCVASIALGSSGREQRRLHAALEEELGRQILPDGGHVSRRAEALLDIAVELLPLRQCHVAQGRAAPRGLITALDRILPALRFHTHADGSLAAHNGTREVRRDRLAAVMELDRALGTGASAREVADGDLAIAPRSAAAAQARESGYQRLAVGQTVVVVDTGRVPDLENASHAHLGMLSFELSSGTGSAARRIVVGLGHVPDERSELSRALRGVAAHSTLAVENVPAGEIVTTGREAWLFDEPLVGGPQEVVVRRADAEDGSWRGFRATHDAFARDGKGAVHARILMLTNDGRALRGEDTLLPPGGTDKAPPGWAPPEATIRFHLHPCVEARVEDEAIVLRPDRGQPWRFRIEGPVETVPSAVVEESFYAGSERPRPTSQIVVELGGRSSLAWTFTREDAEPATR